jgi:aspartate-semialdehyde dehydrogenase
MAVTTMQAVSGAGYPGVASLDILGNVIPYIKNEEEKMEEETQKLLGRLDGGNHRSRKPFTMSAQCNRVAVEDGHTESVSVKLKKKGQAGRNHRRVERISRTPQELRCPARPRSRCLYDRARSSAAPLRCRPAEA